MVPCYVLYNSTSLASSQRGAPKHSWTMLEYLRHLEEDGWVLEKERAKDSSEREYVLGDEAEKKIYFDKSLYKNYIAALAFAKELHQLGVVAIKHGQPAYYYDRFFDKKHMPQVPEEAVPNRRKQRRVVRMDISIDGDSPGQEKAVAASALELVGAPQPTGDEPETESEVELERELAGDCGVVHVPSDEEPPLPPPEVPPSAKPAEPLPQAPPAAEQAAPGPPDSDRPPDAPFAPEIEVDAPPAPVPLPDADAAARARRGARDAAAAGCTFVWTHPATNMPFRLTYKGRAKSWQATCNVHEPIVNMRASGKPSRTYCTKTVKVPDDLEDDVVLDMLFDWCKCAHDKNICSKKDHDKIYVFTMLWLKRWKPTHVHVCGQGVLFNSLLFSWCDRQL